MSATTQKIILTHNKTDTSDPVSGDISQGELALNLSTGKIYLKNAANTSVQCVNRFSASNAGTGTNFVLSQHISENSNGIGIGVDPASGFDLNVNGNVKIGSNLDVGTIFRSATNDSLQLSGGTGSGTSGANIELYGSTVGTTEIRNNAYIDVEEFFVRDITEPGVTKYIRLGADAPYVNIGGPNTTSEAVLKIGDGRSSAGISKIKLVSEASGGFAHIIKGTQKVLTFLNQDSDLNISAETGNHVRLGNQSSTGEFLGTPGLQVGDQYVKVGTLGLTDGNDLNSRLKVVGRGARAALETPNILVTDGQGILMESGIHRITHNDGTGNVQIRFGHRTQTQATSTTTTSGTTSSGATTIQLTQPTGHSNNTTVQFFKVGQGITGHSSIPALTEVSSIDTSTTPSTITLSNALTGSIPASTSLTIQSALTGQTEQGSSDVFTHAGDATYIGTDTTLDTSGTGTNVTSGIGNGAIVLKVSSNTSVTSAGARDKLATAVTWGDEFQVHKDKMLYPGKFGLGTSFPEGNIHIRSNGDTSSAIIETNDTGGVDGGQFIIRTSAGSAKTSTADNRASLASSQTLAKISTQGFRGTGSSGAFVSGGTMTYDNANGFVETANRTAASNQTWNVDDNCSSKFALTLRTTNTRSDKVSTGNNGVINVIRAFPTDHGKVHIGASTMETYNSIGTTAGRQQAGGQRMNHATLTLGGTQELGDNPGDMIQHYHHASKAGGTGEGNRNQLKIFTMRVNSALANDDTGNSTGYTNNLTTKNWTTGRERIQRFIDKTPGAYIEFGDHSDYNTTTAVKPHAHVMFTVGRGANYLSTNDRAPSFGTADNDTTTTYAGHNSTSTNNSKTGRVLDDASFRITSDGFVGVGRQLYGTPITGVTNGDGRTDGKMMPYSNGTSSGSASGTAGNTISYGNKTGGIRAPLHVYHSSHTTQTTTTRGFNNTSNAPTMILETGVSDVVGTPIGPILEFSNCDTNNNAVSQICSLTENKPDGDAHTYSDSSNNVDDERGANIVFKTSSGNPVTITEKMVITARGSVGIGVSNPQQLLHVAGQILATDDITAFSDERLKENINTIPNALKKVTQLRGVEYTRKDTQEKGVGVIAQEIEKVLPEVVVTNSDKEGTKSVAYGNIVGLLIEAIKDLQAEVEELKSNVTTN